MKLRNLMPLLAIGAAALALSSCVDPYYTGTTYSPGYTVSTLPSGYATVTVGEKRYYRHNDVYYRPRGNEYVVVEAPHRNRRDRDRDGILNRYDRYDYDHVVPHLPRGARSVRHNGKVYYRSGDTYYTTRGNGYVVVPGPF